MNSATDSYDLMVNLRPYLFPTFSKDQRAAVLELYEVLHPLVFSGMVSNIVDLGCGTGEILHGLATHICSEYAARSPSRDMCAEMRAMRFIGIDSDGGEIAQAQKLQVKEVHMTWVEAEAETLAALGPGGCFTNTSFNEVFPDAFDWSATLVLCTGHTLPHFKPQFFAFLRTKRPKYFFFDLFHSFDEALRTLRAGTTPPSAYEETMSCVYQRDDVRAALNGLEKNRSVAAGSAENIDRLLFVRRTSMPHGCDMISREVWVYTHSDASPTNSTSYRVLGVEQRGNDSEDYQRDLESAEFRYHRDKVLSYCAGYGYMRGVLYVGECEYSAPLNLAFRDAVNYLESRIFTSDLLVQMRDVARSLHAVIVLPFDKHYTYAVYSDVCDCPRGRAPTFTNVLTDSPLASTKGSAGNTLVPAPALHSCLLGYGSIANVLPLQQRKEFATHLFDSAVGAALAEEKRYLSPQPDSLYFLLPVLLGELPLFCLLVDLGNFLRPAITHQDVYDEILLSWSTVIESRMLPDAVDEFLRRFVLCAVERLLDVDGVMPACLKERAETLRLQGILMGYWKSASDKQWHSWAHMIPTRPVKESARIQVQSEDISGRLRLALDEVLAGALLKGTRWTRAAKFFAGSQAALGTQSSSKNPHESVTAMHIARARAMLIAAFGGKRIPRTVTHLEDITKDTVEKGAFFSPHHFAEDKRLCPELHWLARMIDIAVSHTQKDPSDAYKASNQAYLKAKSVFCGTVANEEDAARFSVWRIMCFFEMYNTALSFSPFLPGGSLLTVDDTERTLFDGDTAVDSYKKCNVVNDKTDELRHFIEMTAKWFVSAQLSVKKTSEEGCEPVSVSCTLTARCREMPKSRGDLATYVPWVKEHCSHTHVPTAWESCTVSWKLDLRKRQDGLPELSKGGEWRNEKGHYFTFAASESP